MAHGGWLGVRGRGGMAAVPCRKRRGSGEHQWRNVCVKINAVSQLMKAESSVTAILQYL